jgi:hypothetical protein
MHARPVTEAVVPAVVAVAGMAVAALVLLVPAAVVAAVPARRAALSPPAAMAVQWARQVAAGES